MTTKFGLRKPVKTAVVLPVGRYTVRIQEARLIDNSVKGSKSINISYRVDNDGEKYHGTYVNSYHLAKNKTAKAVEVGMNQLYTLAEAAGLDLADEPEEEFNTLPQFVKYLNKVLVGKSVVLKLGAPDEGFEKNTVKDFFPV